MRILLLTPFVPSPVAPAGCPRAVFDRIRLLTREHEVTVACLSEPGEQDRRTHLARLGVRLEAVPRKCTGMPSGVRRAVERIRLAGGLVHPYRPMLVQEFSSARLRRRVRHHLEGERPDVVLVEHILMAQYLPLIPADLPVVVTDHDVRLALTDRAPSGRGSQALLARYESARWRRFAARAYRRARVVLVPTSEDAAWVMQQLPTVQPHIVPFGAAPPPVEASGPRRDDVLLFVGNFAHQPNRDAAHWLVHNILPLVRAARPEAQLWLVGTDPTPDVRALAGPGVVVTGRVPSVAPYLARCALFVAPLREGGGMRMKVLEALAAGAPVVTTTIGAAGLDAFPGDDFLVADTTEGLAAAIVSALADPALRRSVGERGRQRATAPQTQRRAQLESVLTRALARPAR